MSADNGTLTMQLQPVADTAAGGRATISGDGERVTRILPSHIDLSHRLTSAPSRWA
jgi:hypothetical protein